MISDKENKWSDIEVDYIILQKMGSGTFGEVVKAQHRESK
jgi:mitogen-activated protein kinase 1/3